jgi:hypothetical protein
MKEFILETVFDDNDSDSLEFTHETRSEEIISIDFESVDKTCFKEELQFEYIQKKLCSEVKITA